MLFSICMVCVGGGGQLEKLSYLQHSNPAASLQRGHETELIQSILWFYFSRLSLIPISKILKTPLPSSPQKPALVFFF